MLSYLLRATPVAASLVLSLALDAYWPAVIVGVGLAMAVSYGRTRL